MKKANLRQKITLIIFGLFLCALLLEVVMRIGGFVYLSLREYRNSLCMHNKGTYRIMCLGESTTICGGDDAYPYQLERILNERNIGIKFKVLNMGVPGTNSSVIASTLEDNLNKYAPNMVITMIGINDPGEYKLYKDMPRKTAVSFIHSLRSYKLMRSLWQHIINKAKIAGVDKRMIKQGEAVIRINDLVLPPVYAGQEGVPPKETIKTDIEKCLEYDKQGWSYSNAGNFEKAEAIFKKAIEMYPRDSWAYINLGQYYINQLMYDKAKQMLKKAVEINPGNDMAYSELGRCYWINMEHEKAEETFKKAIEVNPGSYQAHFDLGWWYSGFRREYAKGEPMFERAIELSPQNDSAYVALGWCYEGQNKYDQAEKIFEKALDLFPGDARMCGALAYLYTESGKYDLAKKFYEKATELRAGHYNPTTYFNYLRIAEIVKARGIKLVCVQYPVLSVELLKGMLRGEKGIIFVDNEMVFKEALSHARYDKYFTDMFAGDFGHCTEEGNRLLAENIANTVLKEYFNK